MTIFKTGHIAFYQNDISEFRVNGGKLRKIAEK